MILKVIVKLQVLRVQWPLPLRTPRANHPPASYDGRLIAHHFTPCCEACARRSKYGLTNLLTPDTLVMYLPYGKLLNVLLCHCSSFGELSDSDWAKYLSDCQQSKNIAIGTGGQSGTQRIPVLALSYNLSKVLPAYSRHKRHNSAS